METLQHWRVRSYERENTEHHPLETLLHRCEIMRTNLQRADEIPTSKTPAGFFYTILRPFSEYIGTLDASEPTRTIIQAFLSTLQRSLTD